MLGSDHASVGIWAMSQGGSQIQGCQLRLREKSGLQMAVSPHHWLGLIPHGVLPSGLGGLLSTVGMLGSRGFWEDPVSGTVYTSWAHSWVGVPSSGPGILRATPEIAAP